MMTPAEVIAELERRGYTTTSRRLIDWRQKELLPPLVKRGRGLGQGWVYGWEDPLVVEQAIAVQELLWMRERTEWLYLPLWCLGFTVPLDRVRPQLLGMLEGHLGHLTGRGSTPVEVGDYLSGLAERSVQQSTRRKGGAPVLPVEAAEYWLNLLAGSPDYRPNLAALERTQRAFASFWRDRAGPGTGPRSSVPATRDLDRIRKWAAANLSLPLMREAVAQATDEQWEQVHRDGQALARVVRASTRDGDDQGTGLEEGWRRIVAAAGPWLVAVDLTLRRHRFSATLDRARASVLQLAEALEADPALRATLHTEWVEADQPEEPGVMGPSRLGSTG